MRREPTSRSAGSAPTTRRTTALTVAALLLAATGLPSARAQQAATSSTGTLALTDPVPVDPLVTVKTLPNGLRYYIYANTTPAKRAELRLVIRAGSVLEDDDQLGMASFLVRMARNGTAHFSKQDIAGFMESLGVKSPVGIRGSASFDYTVYELPVPTDKPEVLDRAFRLLRDWAHDVSFDPAVVERERTAAVEDFEAQSSAADAAQLLAPFRGSRYAERPRFGKRESFEAFQIDRLKQFYTDWYRPDLMAVIAVGDFDKPAIENLIKEHFSSILRPAALRPRLEYPVPDVPGTLIEFELASVPPPLSAAINVFEKAPRRENRYCGRISGPGRRRSRC